MTIEEVEENLLVISDKDNDERSSIAAFTVMYKGFGKFVTKVVAVNLRKMGVYDLETVNTVVNNTFCILYQKPLDFSFPPDAVNDGKFKAWLSVIAKNELIRLLKEVSVKTTSLELLGIEPSTDSDDIEEDHIESVNIQTMNLALSSLPQRDREILLAIYLHHENGKYTPSEVLDSICKMYNTTRPNIRQIRSRSEKKIKEYFSVKSDLKPLK